MARPSKLTPAQWAEVERRAAEGEGARALAKAFGVDEAAIRRRVNPQTPRIKEVAAKVVAARDALAELPVAQQYTALSLADKLRSISVSVASAAVLGARTGHRLHALANSEVSKVDDANPLQSIETLRNVGVLTKLGNDSLAPALNLLSANKDRIKAEDDPDGSVGPELTDAQLARIATASSR
ncbi:MAG: Hin recombinase [Hydrogenophaga sp.]|nr:Hin recombinase [Hydrogenophaga sp.]